LEELGADWQIYELDVCVTVHHFSKTM